MRVTPGRRSRAHRFSFIHEVIDQENRPCGGCPRRRHAGARRTCNDSNNGNDSNKRHTNTQSDAGPNRRATHGGARNGTACTPDSQRTS